MSSEKILQLKTKDYKKMKEQMKSCLISSVTKNKIIDNKPFLEIH